jgi:hypothetical protein
LTIYGPSSANYDIAEDPILLSDWLHRSAFEEFYKEIAGNAGPPKTISMLMNGRGTCQLPILPSRLMIGLGNYTCTPAEIANKNCTTVPDKHETKVKEVRELKLLVDPN